MVVTAVAEIGDPDAETRRFLLKACAIDADKNAAGLRDTFHIGPPLDNADAKQVLADPKLTLIDGALPVARFSAMPRPWPVSAGRRRYCAR
jgi:hypothetical protein